MNAEIAQHLNIAESAILRIEEWKNVLFVVCRKLGARFVSKKVVKMEPTLESVSVQFKAKNYTIKGRKLCPWYPTHYFIRHGNGKPVNGYAESIEQALEWLAQAPLGDPHPWSGQQIILIDDRFNGSQMNVPAAELLAENPELAAQVFERVETL